MGTEDQARGAHTTAGRRRGRGRPQRLPIDSIPSESPELDTTKRVAWLLATNRIMGPAVAGLTRTEFAQRLAEHDVVVDPPKLSRWESGGTSAPIPVLQAYEGVLGLPEGSLVSIQLMTQRVSGQPPTLEDTDHTPDVLDGVFERIESGQASGGDWLALATEVTRYERIYMHPGSWAMVCRRLVNELTRSAGTTYIRRFEAAALLMRHRSGRRYLSRSLGAFVMDPHAQHVTPALSLLSEVEDDGAAELVMRLIKAPNDVLRGGAVRLAAAMASRGQLGTSDPRPLEAIARAELGEPAWGQRSAALELAAFLPASSHDRLLASVTDDKTRTAVVLALGSRGLAPKGLSRKLADRIATAAEHTLDRADDEPDQMLRKLVQEGLFHVQHDRRELAVATIGASPYAGGVAAELVAMTGESNAFVAAMSWAMLRHLAHVIERADLVHGVDSASEQVRASAFVTIGLARGALPDAAADVLLKSARDEEAPRSLRYAALFALGMSGHPHLRELDEGDRPHDAGRWWLEVGSALHDEDDAAPRAV